MDVQSTSAGDPRMCPGAAAGVQYEAIGQGMTRTKTIADGSACCDFHFRTDGVVKLGEPFTTLKLREWGVT